MESLFVKLGSLWDYCTHDRTGKISDSLSNNLDF